MSSQPSPIAAASAVSARGVRPQDARLHHRALVLSLVRRHPDSSRADLARLTGLSRVAISEVVAKLIDEGIVGEHGQSRKRGPGAPARALHINGDARHVVTVAISSADTLEGAVFDLGGTLVSAVSEPRNGAVGKDALLALERMLERLIASATAPILGIGISATGIIDTQGVVRSSSHLEWENVPLRDHIASVTGLPVSVTNGVTAIGVAEVASGAAPDDLFLIRVGNGVGAVTIVNGAVVHGTNGIAGEFGHVIVDPSAQQLCQCGRRGCLEAVLAAPGLRARLAAASSADERSAVLRDAGRALGTALAPVVTALGLANVAISGPAELLDGTLLNSCRSTLEARLFNVVAHGLQVRMAESDESARLRGVFAIVLSKELGIA